MIFHLSSLIAQLKTYFEIKVIQKNFIINRIIGKKVYLERADERILIVIAHVVPQHQRNKQERLDKLKDCLDSLGRSLAAYKNQVILLTKENYSLHEHLPAYLKAGLHIEFSNQQNPMMVEFDAFNIFRKYKENYHYFLFLEDDILVNDSWFLKKIASFNNSIKNSKYVLLPHRFEYSEGIKYYLDQTTTYNYKRAHYHYIDQLSIDIDDIRFCVYENPHAAFYCLNKQQLALWVASAYKWKNKIVAFGPLESAATFVLFENFKLLKPHPMCISYFEIQHSGNKYIKQAALDD